METLKTDLKSAVFLAVSARDAAALRFLPSRGVQKEQTEYTTVVI